MKPLPLSCGAILGASACAFTTAHHAASLASLLTEPTASAQEFTDAVTCCASAIATLAFTWLALSYLALTLATRGHRSSVLIWAARWGTPYVRRSLASLSLAATAMAPIAPYAPALAADDGPGGASISMQAEAIGDISWGSTEPLSLLPSPLPAGGEGAPTTGTAPPTPESNSTPQLSPQPATPAEYEASTAYAPDSPESTVTVMPGDSIWAIAARHLPANASDADIARALPAWLASNPHITNPHLIYPGHSLTIPQEFLS